MIVSAGCGAGNAVSSSEVTTTTAAPTTTTTTTLATKPSAPTGLSYSSSGYHSVALTWNANPETNISGYYVYCSENGSTQYVMLNLNGALETDTTFTIATQSGHSYTVYITAVNNSGLESDQSNSCYFTQ